jgi:hypothetical protein
MSRFLFILLMVFSETVFAQSKTVLIAFWVSFGKEPLELNKDYYLSGDTLQLETVKFYISNIQFYQDSLLVYSHEPKQHLLDLENPHSLLIPTTLIRDKPFNTIQFSLGIDSTTNVSGALGGDLDPTKGMYWTWQSGYINVKIEGKSSKCPARKNRFQYHLGGYQSPFYARQQCTYLIKPKELVHIELPLDAFFEKTDTKVYYEIMSPSSDAVHLSQLLSSLFIID